MMGRLTGDQERLIYEFHLEAVVPDGHFDCKIDKILVLSWLRSEFRSSFSHTGQPSIDPEQMIRNLTVVDCHSRESFAIVPRTSFGAYEVVEVLDRLIRERGKPKSLRCDNEPEFAGQMLDQ